MDLNYCMNLPATVEHRVRVEEFTRKHRLGLLTLLLTDLVGSTKLKQDFGDRPAVNLIQRHRAVLREILAQRRTLAETNQSDRLVL